MHHKIGAALLALVITIPIAAYAQGVVGGAEQGSAAGAAAGGSIGAIVGGAVGAIEGGVAGVLGIDQRPRFRDYAMGQGYPSFEYMNQLRVGDIIAPAGLSYYAVPSGYEYTIINGRIVIVNPQTRQVAEIIE
jgi:hypothetical protein